MAVARSIPTSSQSGSGSLLHSNGDSPSNNSSNTRHSPLTRTRRLSSSASSPIVPTLSSTAAATATRSSTRRPSSSSSSSAALSRPRALSKNRSSSHSRQSNGASSHLLSSSYESKFDRLYPSRGARGQQQRQLDDNDGEEEDTGYSSSLGSKFKRLTAGAGAAGTRHRSGSSSTAATAGTSPAGSTATTIATLGQLDAAEYTGDGKQGKQGKGSFASSSKEKDLLRCEMCHKVYHHPQSLIKHRWQHTEQWRSASSLGLSKHQTVQALEAAVILSHPTSLRLLPDDRSHWPAAVSPPTSGLLGSDQLNIDILRSTPSGATTTRYSQSMPVQRTSRLGSMLASEENNNIFEEEDESVVDDDGAERDDSTDSAESDFGMLDDDLDENEERAKREDTELGGMDQEMFSLDLQSAHGSQAGTPAMRYAALPDIPFQQEQQQQQQQSSGLAYTRQSAYRDAAAAAGSGQPPRFTYGFGTAGLQTIPSQVSMTAFAAAGGGADDQKNTTTTNSYRPQYYPYGGSLRRKGQTRGAGINRDGSAGPSSSEQTTASSSSSSNHSEAPTGTTGENRDSSLLAAQNGGKPLYPHMQQPPSSSSTHLSPSRHASNAATAAPISSPVPNLSISAPVLGFFTERTPYSANVVSPHLGPTRLTSPSLLASGGGRGPNPHLAPIPAGNAAAAAVGIPGNVDGNGYSPAEAAAAEVLSSSHNSSHLAFEDRAGQSSSYVAGAAGVGASPIPTAGGGGGERPQIPAMHGRTLSNGRTALLTSSSPYARSPMPFHERPSIIGSAGGASRSFSSPSAQQQQGGIPASVGAAPQAAAGVYGTSFGQAPLGSSFRSIASYIAGGGGHSPALRPVINVHEGTARKFSSPPHQQQQQDEVDMHDHQQQQQQRGLEDDDDEIMDMDL